MNPLNTKDYENLDAYFLKILVREHNKHHIKIGTDAITSYDEEQKPIPAKDKYGNPKIKTYLRWAKCLDCNILIGIVPITDVEMKILQNHGVIPTERTDLPYIKFGRERVDGDNQR